MAESKKSFVLYSDLISIVKKLVLKDRENKTNYAGELFLHILEYVNSTEPIPINFIIEMAFEPIKLQLKRDLEKYEVVKEKRSQAGKKSAEVKKQIVINSTNSTLVESVEHSSTNSTVNDTDTVNGNGNVNDNDILLGKETKEIKFDFKKSLIIFGFKENLINDWLLIRKNKKATNSKTAFDLFVKQVQKANKDPNEILELCIAKDWKGFQAEWVNNLQNQNSHNGKQYSNSGGANTNQGYKPASVDTEKLVRELTNDIEVGNVPGQY